MCRFVPVCAGLCQVGPKSLQSSHDTFIDPLLYISMGYSHLQNVSTTGETRPLKFSESRKKQKSNKNVKSFTIFDKVQRFKFPPTIYVNVLRFAKFYDSRQVFSFRNIARFSKSLPLAATTAQEQPPTEPKPTATDKRHPPKTPRLTRDTRRRHRVRFHIGSGNHLPQPANLTPDIVPGPLEEGRDFGVSIFGEF
jgi:hypothetical protein